MSLAGLLPSLIDMTRFEVLRAFHVLLFAWREVLTQIGELARFLPLLPELSFAFVSTLLIFLNVIMPVAMGYARIYHHDYRHPESAPVVPLGISPLTRLIFNYASLSFYLLCLLAFFFSLMSENAVCIQDFCLDAKSGTLATTYILPALAFLSLIFALGALPRMKSGAMAVLGFIFFAEVAYFLASPTFSSSFKDYVCEISDVPEGDC